MFLAGCSAEPPAGVSQGAASLATEPQAREQPDENAQDAPVGEDGLRARLPG